MASAVEVDEDGHVTITIKDAPSSPERYEAKFHLSEIHHLDSKRPKRGGEGWIQFFLSDGSHTDKLHVATTNKAQFDNFVIQVKQEMKEHDCSSESDAPGNEVTFSRVVEAPKSGEANWVKKRFNTYGALDAQADRGQLPPPLKWDKVSDRSGFVAVDVEWADGANPASVIEIGLAKFLEGKLVDTYRSYVRPSGKFRMGDRESETHFISRELVESAPTLGSMWHEIETFIDGHVWVLQNATNDVNKILASAGDEVRQIAQNFLYLDTMLIARKMPWVTSKSGLGELSAHFGVERRWASYDGRDNSPNPHGAMEDAAATGAVLTKMMELVGYKTLLGFAELVGTTPGEVQSGLVTRGASAPGKIAWPHLDKLPSETDLLAKSLKADKAHQQSQNKRAKDEGLKVKFLGDPQWSTMRVDEGMTVCFTQLLPWDDNDENHEQAVWDAAKKLGITTKRSVTGEVDLLVVNDHAVKDSAKLRNALARKNPIPVTTYSIFCKHNPDFPEWHYMKAWQYKQLKAEGHWR